MKIRELPCIVYDIEVFKNVFHCTLYNTETEEFLKFECSERKNEIQKMCKYFTATKAYFVGYNNIHYDNPIINYCIEFFTDKEYSADVICKSIFNLSSTITSDNDENLSKWKKWKYAKYFKTLDLLTMLYSKALRVSLKAMQVTMMYKNVQEFVTDWQAPLELSKIDSMIEYNVNDVMSTTELLNRCKADIELRTNIEDEHKIECLSKDGVGIGVELLKQEYIKKTGISWEKLSNLRSPQDIIPLKDVILPNITFKTPVLANLLAEMKSLKVSAGKKSWNKKLLLGNLEVSVGVGGIHSINKPEIIVPKDDELLLDSDVTSMYPSLIIQYGFVPPHLNKDVFIDIYSTTYRERLLAKKEGRKLENETKKLTLNSVTGNYQNSFSWLYSPFAVMQIRINGQLILLMLCERLLSLGATIHQINTDGVLYSLKRAKYDELQAIITEFQNLTRLEFETDEYKSFYQLAVNDYFTVSAKGSIKEKGCFITKTRLGKGLTPKIIPKAVQAYFLNNVPIEDTIKNCTNIHDFLMSQKVDKKFEVEYNGELIQRINRFYASTNGAYLYRCKIAEKDFQRQYQNKDGSIGYINFKKGQHYDYANLLTSSGITLLNKLNDIDIKDRKINYRYYISEANKIIAQMKIKQLSLF